jgi:hypothetical protein
MKKMTLMLFLVLSLSIPTSSYALLGVVDIEAAVGGWYAAPSGDMKYKSPGRYDMEDTFGFGDEAFAMGRVMVDVPVIPTIYLLATPMEFKDKAKTSLDRKSVV